MERLGYMAINDYERYKRQLLMPEVGKDGQECLTTKSALVIGAGGLGAPILLYLVASGIGRLGIVDRDKLEVSNLNRQVLYSESDLGGYKAELAKHRLSALNSHCHIESYTLDLCEANALDLIRGYDIVIDATDNLRTRYLIDDTTQQLGIPYLYGAVEGFVGQASLFGYGGGCGYRELFPDYEAEADTLPIGIIGATAGVLGSIMASEALKVLLGLRPSLAGVLLRYDLRTMHFDRIKLY